MPGLQVAQPADQLAQCQPRPLPPSRTRPPPPPPTHPHPAAPLSPHPPPPPCSRGLFGGHAALPAQPGAPGGGAGRAAAGGAGGVEAARRVCCGEAWVVCVVVCVCVLCVHRLKERYCVCLYIEGVCWVYVCGCDHGWGRGSVGGWVGPVWAAAVCSVGETWGCARCSLADQLHLTPDCNGPSAAGLACRAVWLCAAASPARRPASRRHASPAAAGSCLRLRVWCTGCSPYCWAAVWCGPCSRLPARPTDRRPHLSTCRPAPTCLPWPFLPRSCRLPSSPDAGVGRGPVAAPAAQPRHSCLCRLSSQGGG